MEAVEQVEFSKSAFSAADGGRLSGVLRLTGKAKTSDTIATVANVSMLSAGGLFSVPLGSRGSFVLAGRRSFQTPLYNDILGLFSTSGALARGGRAARFSGGVFQSTPESWFYDLNGKFELAVTDKDRLSISLYKGRDDLDNSRDLPVQPLMLNRLASQGIVLPTDSVMEISDIQDWGNVGAGVAWTHRWSPSSLTAFSVGYSTYANNRSRASLVTSPSTGEDYSVSVGRGGSSGLAEANDLRDVTARLDNSIALGARHVLSVGAETTTMDVDYAIQTEVVQAMGPGGAFGSRLAALLARSDAGFIGTVYASDTWTPGTRLVLTPGVRVSRYELTDQTYVEPRVNARYQLTRRIRVKGGWGLFNQMINRITREDLAQGDREFWTLADGAVVPVAKSQQFVGGASFETAGFLVDVEGYHKTLDDLTTFAPRLTPGADPGDGTSFLHRGSGTAKGLEVLLQKKFGDHTGWVSYTGGRIEYAFPSLEADPFVASHDQTHEIKVADSLRVGEKWTFGGTWIVATGRPYTPAVAVEPITLPAGPTVSRITFGAKNSERLPAYHRLDLSLQRNMSFLGSDSTLGVTASNVYDRKNVWYREYQTFGGTGSVNDVTLMGRAINVFLRLGF
jgi:hypothetical protein